MAKLRLIHDATKAQRASVSVKSARMGEDEFARKILTSHHGPTCAAYLARKFKRSIKKNGYFVVRLPVNEEMPMWFSLAMRLFDERSTRWCVREIDRPGSRLWKVTYLRRGLFARPRGTHLRVV